MRPRRLRELVLVGGGHAHVQVLQRFIMKPDPDVRVTTVLDQPLALYSGMVPGVLAGDYQPWEAEIDVWALARRANARIVDAAATGLDRDAGRVLLEGRPPLRYDVLSFDVGSTVAGLDIPGVREHAIATRPIGRFVDRITAAMLDKPSPRIVVVGGGAGGVEVAFTLQHRTKGQLTLVDGRREVLPGWTAGFGAKVIAAAEKRGIHRVVGRVTSVEPGRVHLDAAPGQLPFDLLVWVTGAAPHPWMAALDLPKDDLGFLRVGNTLQSSDRAIFGAGDCVAVGDHRLPKAGVYAVREGPILAENLVAALYDRPLRPYKPQTAFLSLLNLGGGDGIGARGALSFRGAWVWRQKDRIDRKFMRMFQSIGPDDRPTFTPMADADMTCGGCAAKVGPGELARVLARMPIPKDPSVEIGLATADDIAVVHTPAGDRLGLSIDAFTAFCDDPWSVGQIAAINALNDLYAKGMVPRWALAIVGIPDDGATEDTLHHVMAGARSVLDASRVTLVGGHTLRTDVLQIGFSVTGVGEGMRTKAGLEVGDSLILTRALGTGVLFYAHAAGRARGVWIREAMARMARTHRESAKVASRFGVHAATDVTGFGLAGHLLEMTRASSLGARIHAAKLPILPGAQALLDQGLRSTYHSQNEHARASMTGEPPPILFDPQTAGGMLFGVRPDLADEALAALHDAGERDAAIIGVVTEGVGVEVR